MRDCVMGITQLKTLLGSVCVAVIAVVLLWQSETAELSLVQESLLANVGGLMLVSVSLYLLFEFWLRRAWVNELFAEAQAGEKIRAAGLRGISTDFSSVDWADHFAGSARLDLWFSYALTWNHEHHGEITKLLRQPGAKVRVLLPAHQDSEVMGDLARRFGMQADEVRNKIEEVIGLLESLPVPTSGSLELRVVPMAPVFTFYRFDDSVVVAMFHHRQRLDARVVCMEAEAPGDLYTYMGEEFEGMWGVAEPVTSSAQGNDTGDSRGALEGAVENRGK